ncbi:nuclear protein DGCR14 [Phlebopus sp. FC_14]|nr:nuclear protein DGCR14 [Phlebopus sp. FC_14]
MSSSSEAGPSSTTKSLNRQEILEEDEYTEALSHIIARDFFPSLVHLNATNDYLDAVNPDDASLVNASVRRLQGISGTSTHAARSWQTPAATPYGNGVYDTPLRTPSGEPPIKRPRYDANMNLDMFQAKYTSEDNSSFTQIMHEENRQRREKWGWAWEAQKRVEDQRGRMLEGRERMLVEQPQAPGVRERFVIEAPEVAGLITANEQYSPQENQPSTDEDNSDEKGLVIAKKYDTEDEPLDVLAPQRDTRPAGVDAWKFKTRNSLMFPPDADVSPYDPSTWIVPTRAPTDSKLIKHGNTRLSEQDDGEEARSMSSPPSPTRSRIDAAITGTPYGPRSPHTSGFTLVAKVPSPNAAEMGPSAMKQLMTWGTLNATPRILSHSDDPAESMPPPNTFQISAPSHREALSHKLSASAAKSLRAKAGLIGASTPLLGRTTARTPTRGPTKPNSMGPPTWTPRRADASGNLTPAAKRLLDRTTMGTAAARRADAMGRTAGWGGSGNAKEKDLNHMRWTPTPSRG